MAEPLRLRFTDLVRETRRRPHHEVIGRETELRRFARTLSRRTAKNVIVTGPPGVGKTALVWEFVSRVAAHALPHAPSLPYIQLDTQQCARFLHRQPSLAVLDRLRAALASLREAVVWIDDAGNLLAECGKEPWMLETVLQPFFEHPGLRLVLTLTDQEYNEWIEPFPLLQRTVEVLQIAEPSPRVCETIVAHALPRYEHLYGITITGEVPATTVALAQQFQTGRVLPDRALRLLDEACAECQTAQPPTLTSQSICAVFAERTGIPVGTIQTSDHEKLARLPATLRAHIRGQDHAVAVVADTVRRGWLGLRDPSRPIGSFLFLGPSGVGKTECAKVLAETVYGDARSFIRLDMSEFAESHTRQRLIGSPPGYVGHEEGGQLTNPVALHPFSLILLDEIEKAHPSLFDLFLQVLDDGRLTDGKGQTVDFTKTIIIATSNIAAEDIAAADDDVTSPAFRDERIIPRLLTRFRPEFVNRFDAIVPFRRLSREVLLDIARLELRAIEKRLRHHHVRFHVSDERLQHLVAQFVNPRFGARPLKRHLEHLCERLVSETLLSSPLLRP